MRISDWSSDVCSSDLEPGTLGPERRDLRSLGGGLADRDVAGTDVPAGLLLGLGEPRREVPARRLLGVVSGVREPQRGAADVGAALAAARARGHRRDADRELGRASCRERVVPYVLFLGAPGALNKKKK